MRKTFLGAIILIAIATITGLIVNCLPRDYTKDYEMKGKILKEATCTESGYFSITDEETGEEIVTEIVSVGHYFEFDKCIYCGKNKSDCEGEKEYIPHTEDLENISDEHNPIDAACVCEDEHNHTDASCICEDEHNHIEEGCDCCETP